MKKSKFYWFWTIALPINWLLVQWLAKYPEIVEKYYSTGMYIATSKIQRILFGWIPFSIGDILYIVAGFLIIKSFIKIIQNRKIDLVKTIGIVSIFYFSFQFLWGLNYLRVPIDRTFKIENTEYTTEELNVFAIQLIDKINNVQLKITGIDSLEVEVPHMRKEIYAKIVNGYENLHKSESEISFKYTSSKHSIISLPLSYMGFSGYLNMFTGEAQVNSLGPLVSYPATSCHEVAHQLGFAAENEANFIGFLAAINNDDLYFQYSGYLLALRYVLNNLANHDKEVYSKIVKKLHRGVVKNIIESRKHWSQFQNPLEPVFKIIFNQILKANNQPEGIKSYNLMVGLLINYNKTQTIF